MLFCLFFVYIPILYEIRSLLYLRDLTHEFVTVYPRQ